MELAHLVEQGSCSALALGKLVDPNHVANESAQLGPRYDLDRTLDDHQEVAATQASQRDTQFLDVDFRTGHDVVAGVR